MSLIFSVLTSVSELFSIKIILTCTIQQKATKTKEGVEGACNRAWKKDHGWGGWGVNDSYIGGGASSGLISTVLMSKLVMPLMVKSNAIAV